MVGYGDLDRTRRELLFAGMDHFRGVVDADPSDRRSPPVNVNITAIPEMLHLWVAIYESLA